METKCRWETPRKSFLVLFLLLHSTSPSNATPFPLKHLKLVYECHIVYHDTQKTPPPIEKQICLLGSASVDGSVQPFQLSAVNKWIFIGVQVGAGCLNTCLIMEEMCSISGGECGVI